MWKWNEWPVVSNCDSCGIIVVEVCFAVFILFVYFLNVFGFDANASWPEVPWKKRSAEAFLVK